MSSFSAVTIRKPEAEIAGRLAEADLPLSGPEAQIAYAVAPGDRGTEVRVTLPQTTPGGKIGQKLAAAVTGDPQSQLEDALRRYKQLLETGEVVRSEGSPDGANAQALLKQQTAEPVAPTD